MSVGPYMKLVRAVMPLLALLAAIIPETVRAQEVGAWPDRPITMVIPYPPGAGVDIPGRRIAQALGTALGVPVVVENKPGAGANLGAAFVSNAQTDGHTLLFSSYGNLIIDAASVRQHTLTPVSPIGSGAIVMLVRPNAPYQNLDEFVSYARAHPNKINFASVGMGSSFHLMIEQMMALGNLAMTHIPYRGGIPAMTDLLAGRVDAHFATWLFAKPYIEEGKLQAIAVTGDQRSPAAPELPTVSEKAVPGARITDGLGIFVPQGTPQAIVTRLNTELQRIVHDPDMKAWLLMHDLTPRPMTSAEFAAMLGNEADQLFRLIRDNNIQLQ